tara:strand:+ start:179 stop:952 length:774 start_codon:yes stop_codon:yes gene_type:complete
MAVYEWQGKVLIPPSGIIHDLPGLDFGNVPQVTRFRKFGYNPSIAAATDPEDIISQGGIHPGPLTAAASTIVSDDSNDTSAGTGAQTVKLWGQLAGGTETTETAIMDGATPVNLANSYECITRVRTETVGTNASNVGNLIIKIGAVTVVDVLPGASSTLSAWYRVPAGYTYYIYSMGASLGDKTATAAEIEFRHTPVGGASRIEEKFSVHSGAAPAHIPLAIPEPFGPGDIAVMRCFEVTGTTDISAHFEGILVANA